MSLKELKSLRPTYDELKSEIQGYEEAITLAKSEHKCTEKLEMSLLVAEERMMKTISRGTP